MSESVVAYRYAKALIDLAVEKNVVKEVNDDMTFFTEVCNANKDFQSIMSNPIIRHSKKLNILGKIFENNVHPVTFSIFDVLTRKNRESLIYPIAQEFRKLFNTLNKIEVANVTSVEPLTEAQKESFLNIVKNATGKSVKLIEEIDPSLIGGYILKVGDVQLDTSVRKSLNELKLAVA